VVCSSGSCASTPKARFTNSPPTGSAVSHAADSSSGRSLFGVMPIPKSTNGEMPFLDHLEELRWRIIYAGIALAIGVAVGLTLAFHYDLVAFLAKPALPFMGGQKLIVTHPADLFSIQLQLAFAVGIGISAPVIGY